jgi:hypothetical protein
MTREGQRICRLMCDLTLRVVSPPRPFLFVASLQGSTAQNCYVMLWCPFYTPISAVSSWGWWLHATSASGRRAPATEHIWMPKSTLVRRWAHRVRVCSTQATRHVVRRSHTLRLPMKCYDLLIEGLARQWVACSEEHSPESRRSCRVDT